MTPPRLLASFALISIVAPSATSAPASAQSPARTKAVTPDVRARRPMTFLDRQLQRDASSPVPSVDGKWMLYTLSTPDWSTARRQSDIYLVSLERGLPSTRQMTFTRDKSETSPLWLPDGGSFVFLSNRDAPASATSSAATAATPADPSGAAGARGSRDNQIYLMRVDGGEARKITDAREGISNAALSNDGHWLVYRSGRADNDQLYAMRTSGLDSAKAVQITTHPTGVGLWKWSPDNKHIYFITADTVDRDERLRRERRFTVNVRNPLTPLSSLWALDVETHQARRLTRDTSLTVTDFNVSPDGKWIGFHGTSTNRYQRNITEQDLYSDLYLLNTGTGAIERLTNNTEVGESDLIFSPDSRLMAFAANDDLTRYTMTNNRVYLRRVDDTGGQWKKLGQSFDGDAGVGFWSPDSKTIYFNEGWKATNQVFALDIEKNTVKPVTNLQASVTATRQPETGVVLVNYSDPKSPTNIFTVRSLAQLGDRSKWIQLTDANPEIRYRLLGEEEEITWRSTDGTMVGGVLVKPVGYEPRKKYPLIVAIHGGPASADVLGFNGGYQAQVYAGDGYVVLRPNYRGSTNYGEKFKTGIVGNYFPRGFEDIMTGVDYLIDKGIVDGTKMGALGWSAGGHWSNWILTHTDRFKAISTGAGVANWISMYAETDVQRNRQFYLGDKLPYDNFEAYWDQSPLKYIKSAKTPTMIHVVEGDPRVPRPQSEELFMALKRLGVPTEFYVYPGNTHGIPDPRNQLVKAIAEKAWMDYWVRGSGKKFAWRDVLTTVPADSTRPTVIAEPETSN